MAPSKTMSSRLGPADAEFERKRRRASEDHVAEARFCADQMIQLMRPMQASRAAFIEATKDHYLLLAMDGDAYHFVDFMANMGFDGGRARNAIREALSAWCNKLNGATDPDIWSWGELTLSQIHCTVFLNLEDQIKKLRELRPEITADLVTFLRELRTDDRFWDFKDAGRRPQAADKELKAKIKACWTDPKCAHLFLALTHDKGYSRMLRNSIGLSNDEASGRVTLVTGKSTHPNYLKLRCPIITMPTVFVDSDLDPACTPLHPPTTQSMAGIGVTPKSYSLLYLQRRPATILPLCCLKNGDVWFHIAIVYPTQHVRVFGVDTSTTIARIKRGLADLDGVPPQFQHLQMTARSELPDAVDMQSLIP